MAVSKPVATDARETTPARAPKTPRKAGGAVAQPLPAANRLAPGLVGARLRERRMARGISLRQFARDIDVSASFISQLETGKAQPSVATFFSICAALDISIDELFTDEESLNSTNGDTPIGLTDAANNQWNSPAKITGGPVVQRGDTGGASSPVVRPNERKVLVLDSGVTWESLTSSHHEKTDFMFVRYEVGGSSTLEDRLIRHAGMEYGFILSGTLQIALGFDTHVLNAGDSISFDSSRPHRLYNIGEVAVEAIWVNMEFRGN
jgi:transcriptional regulator with XRE-family HTH domain/mannose-6-phosphate isomerase-like protein (cupin superfamily)